MDLILKNEIVDSIYFLDFSEAVGGPNVLTTYPVARLATMICNEKLRPT